MSKFFGWDFVTFRSDIATGEVWAKQEFLAKHVAVFYLGRRVSQYVTVANLYGEDGETRLMSRVVDFKSSDIHDIENTLNETVERMKEDWMIANGGEG